MGSRSGGAGRAQEVWLESCGATPKYQMPVQSTSAKYTASGEKYRATRGGL